MTRRIVTAATRHKLPPVSRERLEELGLAKKSRKKPKYLEAIQQRLFVKRWRLDPRTKHLPACAIPNGGKRGKLEAALLKAEGVEKGAPDWVLFAPGLSAPMPPEPGRDGGQRGRVGLALEFKSPDGTGRQSDEQAAWQRKLEQCGWRYEIVTTADEAWRVLCDYLGIVP